MPKIVSYDMLDKWDLRFIKLANEVSSWSKDPNTKVGAVIISPDKKHISYGFNGFPRNIQDDHRLNDKFKNQIMVHAELNAIINSQSDLTGWTIYCTKSPCSSCSLALIQAGIARVVTLAPSMNGKWFESQQIAETLLTEAGVQLLWVEE